MTNPIVEHAARNLNATHTIDWVKIGPYMYKVRPLTEEEREEDEAWGHSSFLRQEVAVYPRLQRRAWLETLLHEVHHVINHVADIQDKTTEEDSVTRSTPLWLAFWIDNGHVLELLNEECRVNA